MKHYTIISGTGRAGTTLLVRILTRAGLDTGYDLATLENDIDPLAKAGLERDLRSKPDSYVVKSPWIATYVEQIFPSREITIDHAIICMRDLHAAAESRRRIQRMNATEASVRGGLWGTTEPEAQEAYLTEMFYRLIFHLTQNGVPLTFLHFPRFATDHGYAIDKLSGVFPDVEPERFRAALQLEVAPDLIFVGPPPG